MSSINARRRRIRSALITMACVVGLMVLIGGITVLSQRNSGEEPERKVVEITRLHDPVQKAPSKRVTTRFDGSLVVQDEGGQTRDLTPEEQRRLAIGLAQTINRSVEGLVQMRYDDGSVSIDLEGHFENVMMAKVESDGSVTTACADDLDAAAAFFKIDPAIIEAARQKVIKGTRIRPINQQ